MSGTITGGRKAAETNKIKYGEDFYKIIAAKGGRAKVPKGFSMMTRKQRSLAGTLGGRKSKRRPSNNSVV